MVSDAKTMHAFDRNPFSLTQWGYVCFYLTRKPHFFDDVTPKKYLICFLAVIFSHGSVPFSVFSRVMVQSAPIHWQASTLRKQLNIIAPQRYTGQNHTGSFSTKKVAFCNVYHCRTPLYVNKQLTHGHSLITILLMIFQLILSKSIKGYLPRTTVSQFLQSSVDILLE